MSSNHHLTWRRTAALAAILLTAWGAAAAAPRGDAAIECAANGATPLWAPDGTRFAYLSDAATPGDRQIFVADPSDCAPRQVTSLGSRVGSYSWSGDGMWIALSGKSSAAVEDDIFIVEVDTGAILQCTNTSTDTDSDPVWSPDGSTILYATEFGHGSGFFETHKLDPADCLPAPPGGYEPGMCLTCSDGTFDSLANWSNDGDTIVWIHHSTFNGPASHRLMDPNGNNVRTCAQNQPFPWRGIAFSPDDSKVIFNRGGGGGQQIAWFDPNVCDPNMVFPVTDPSEGFDEAIAPFTRNQAWFPSGRAIAYHTNRGGDYEIYAADPMDPNHRLRLTSDASTDKNPVVSRDGAVAFECDTGGQTGICLLGPAARVTASHTAPAQGSTITACVEVEPLADGESLGSYGAVLNWDPGVLQYLQSVGGDAPFDTPVVNEADVSAGRLRFADADAAGAAGTARVLCVELDVIGTAGDASALDLELTSLFAAGSFTDLTPIAGATDDTVGVVLECTVGDVIPDGAINSGDALAVLSYEVMLPLPALFSERIAARCGDANGDGATNSIDALIMLSYEIGLPIDPILPVGGSNRTFDTCPAASAASLLPAAGPGAAIEGGLRTTGPIIAFLDSAVQRVHPGQEISMALRVDMGTSGDPLGSYGATLSWPPRQLELVSVSGGGPGGFPAPVANDGNADGGILRIAQAHPHGSQGLVDLAVVTFRAKRSLRNPAGAVDLGFTSLGGTAPSFDDLMGRLSIRDSGLRLMPRR